jgi:pimeloyl-ACP methyl ester carboxylesterase
MSASLKPDEDEGAEAREAAQDIVHGHIFLPSKPSAALAVSRVETAGHSDLSTLLIVFVNGLILPKSAWLPVMQAVLDSLQDLTDDGSRPEMLAYDRYGQGLSDPDPLDAETGKEPGYGHGILDVVDDLDQLINHIQRDRVPRKRLVFVASSIGCPISRLYTQKYENTAAGIVFLDSMMANQNFIDMFPDPSRPDFDPSTLPDGITTAILIEQRQQFRQRFAPDVKNGEGLDRRNLPELLPESDAPLLLGSRGKPPFLTVVGHDKETFARQSLEGDMKTPVVFTESYMQPTWERYNQGLLKLSEPDRVKGVIIAQGCGHFIPRDDPAFSAATVVDMIQRVTGAI